MEAAAESKGVKGGTKVRNTPRKSSEKERRKVSSEKVKGYRRTMSLTMRCSRKETALVITRLPRGSDTMPAALVRGASNALP